MEAQGTPIPAVHAHSNNDTEFLILEKTSKTESIISFTRTYVPSSS